MPAHPDETTKTPGANPAALGLTDERTENVRVITTNPKAELPFADEADYAVRGILAVKRDFCVWRMADNPDSEIAFPSQEPSYPRLSLHDIIEIVRSIPDLRLVKRFTIRDDVDSNEGWLRQLAGSKYAEDEIIVDARADAAGNITLYRPAKINQAKEAALREWFFLLMQSEKQAAHAFASVGNLEPLNLEANVDMTNSEAAWCQFGLQLMMTDPAAPVLVAEMNPIRASIVNNALLKRLRDLPPQLRCRLHEQIMSVGKHIAERVTLKATIDLNDSLQGPDSDKVRRIGIVLEFLQS
jgi:hypothetical protein